jgi:hypothetical protein
MVSTPSVSEPSRNVTLPEGEPLDAVTVAVKVEAAPNGIVAELTVNFVLLFAMVLNVPKSKSVCPLVAFASVIRNDPSVEDTNVR